MTASQMQIPMSRYARQLRPAKQGVGRRGRVVVNQGGAEIFIACAMPAPCLEVLGRNAPAEISGQPCRQYDGGERKPENKNGEEGEHRDCPQQRIFQCPRSDAIAGKQHDGDHRGLDAVEHARHGGHATVSHVYPRQRQQDEKRGQHKQAARDDAAPGPVHQPADVGGELLRLRPRQHHAVVERVQKAPLGDPAHALDQVLMHDRDLPRRSAEADETQFQPIPESLSQRDRFRGLCVVGNLLLRCIHDSSLENTPISEQALDAESS